MEIARDSDAPSRAAVHEFSKIQSKQLIELSGTNNTNVLEDYTLSTVPHPDVSRRKLRHTDKHGKVS